MAALCYTKEQVKEASSTDLLTYLQTREQGSIKPSGPGEWCLKEHDSLKISNGKWYWFSRGIGGTNALSFLVKVREMRFQDAVELLLGSDIIPRVRLPTPQKPPKEERKLQLPRANWNNGQAGAYLINVRGIDPELVQNCIRSGAVYESAPRHECVFIGRDDEQKIRYAALRSTTSPAKKDAPGSDKRYGFSVPAATDGRSLIVSESPIDALSIMSLHKSFGHEWQKNHYISLGGVSPLAALTFLASHKEVRRVYVCLDNDKAGHEAAERLRELINEQFPDRKLRVDIKPPKRGKDYNEYWKQASVKPKHEKELMCL